MKRLLFFISILLTFAISAYGQQADYENNRTALVIGNSNYTSAPLKNPENDAIAISATLRDLGFDVIERTNLDGRGMKMALREFSEKLKENPGVGLFYYAGHGIQSEGTNYLVPINSVVEEQFEIEFECIKADRALAVMELSDNPFNIVIMDACRNNPFRSFSRSADKGFTAPSNPPTGSIVAFATQPGKTASDGTGNNGLYTQELVKAMKTPGIPIEDVFKQVRINVSRMSDKKQVPQEWSSLMGDFYFKSKPAPIQQPVATTTKPSGSTTVEVDDSEAQITFGKAKKAKGNLELTTLMSGILYLDGEVLNNGQAIESGIVIPMNNIDIGNHSLEIRGQSGNWKQDIQVLPNSTSQVIAQLAGNKVATSNGRDMNGAKHNTPIGDLIPKDEGDLEVYTSSDVDKKAAPVGGMIAFQMFVKEKVKYPKLAKSAKITGQVQVQFTVEKNGVITDPKVVRTLGYGCDEEALRMMNELPYCWKPATKNGNAVRQTVVLGVPFAR